MKLHINTLKSYGESAIAFLTAGCVMSPIVVPVVQPQQHRSSIFQAVRGVARAVNRAARLNPALLQNAQSSSTQMRLAGIAGKREQVMQRLNNIYTVNKIDTLPASLLDTQPRTV